MGEQVNEGEGNRTAARKYNQEQAEFAKSGRVEKAAQDAARALDGPEAADLQRAVEAGNKPAMGSKGR